MRQHSNLAKDTAEKVVKDIRRATRKQYSAEEKIRIVLEGLRGEASIAGWAAARVSRRTCTIAGRRTSWRLARSAWPVTRLRAEFGGVRMRHEARADGGCCHLTRESRLLKKSVTADGEDEA